MNNEIWDGWMDDDDGDDDLIVRKNDDRCSPWVVQVVEATDLGWGGRGGRGHLWN